MSRFPDPGRPPLATRADVLYLAALAGTALLAGGHPVGSAREVAIRFPGGVRREPFVPGRIAVDGPLGTSVLELDPAGGVRFVASPCPGQDCVRMGRVAGAGTALACLPNRILVELGGGASGGLDAVTR
jgi:hypothetical protein